MFIAVHLRKYHMRIQSIGTARNLYTFITLEPKNIFGRIQIKKHDDSIFNGLTWKKVFCSDGQGGYSRIILFCSSTRCGHGMYTKYFYFFHYLKYFVISNFDMDYRKILGPYRLSRSRQGCLCQGVEYNPNEFNTKKGVENNPIV